ncbi:hypothetical protein LV828_13045 [[Clostridium] innocuum]|nr:hypothetical protein [[Clostridium] innocuum]MCI2983869.1 hypothetical protein [[Clostridium] innocuum]MCR0338225.1 hypothetical protein [[Clostridium] innocuum]
MEVDDVYIIKNKQPSKIETTTFADLHMKESDIEEILRQNVDMLCDDEESMLIIGQQVKNESNGRSDLTAIDNEGDIVLIEIKRDKADIVGRKEAFEFQAIRYAAGYATIRSTDELIQNIFAPYVEKHIEEFRQQTALNSSEIAKRLLSDFVELNNITAFNTRQRIILVASEFDDQTLSAVAWLNSNQVDISCYQICAYKLNDDVLLDIKKILPVVDCEDFYVNVTKKGSLQKDRKKDISRRSLPKIDSLIEWKLVEPGDIITAKGRIDEAVLQENGQVKAKEGIMSIQQWLKRVFGWSSVETYAFSVDKKSGKTLSELRQEYMEKVDAINTAAE